MDANFVHLIMAYGRFQNLTTISNIDNIVHLKTIDNVIVTLNLTQYQVQLPTDHILDQSPRWMTSNLSPLAANLLVQVLNCSDDNEKYARIILNDAVISLENLGSCGKNEDGRCNLNTFMNGLEDALKSTDFDSVCS